MSLDKAASCPDFARDFDGFLDGELDPQSLRAMALHADQCPSCGADLARAERLHGLLSSAVEEAVDRVDTSALWASIEAVLEPKHVGFRARVWRAVEGALSAGSWIRPVPALALSGAAAALLAFWLWPSASSEPVAVEVANNHAQIERIASSAPHVAVWSEPERHTTAIWVASYDPEGP